MSTFLNKKQHLILFIGGLAGALVFACFLIDIWLWLGITSLFAFLYSAPKIQHPLFSSLRKIAVGKTIFLALAWTHVTALLPLIIHINLVTSHMLFIVNRFFFIYAICILFDYRDVHEDRKIGIKTLITSLDEKGIDTLFWSSMFVFAITTIFLYNTLSLITIIALFVPGIVLALLYYPAKKNFSDYLYYFVLDGLMMMSAPLLLLIKFAR